MAAMVVQALAQTQPAGPRLTEELERQIRATREVVEPAQTHSPQAVVVVRVRLATPTAPGMVAMVLHL